MEQVERCLREIGSSLQTGIRDHSLLRSLNQLIASLEMHETIVEKYCRMLLSLYDLSNSPKLMQGVGDSHLNYDEMALLIKECWLDMLGHLIVFYSDNPQIDLPRELMQEVLQLAILVSRVLIDLEWLTSVVRNHPLVTVFYGAFSYPLKPEIQITHCLNTIELQKIQLENQQIHAKQLAASFEALQDAQSNQITQYTKISQAIAFQSILKLLKQSRHEEARLLKKFISPEMLQDLEQLGLPHQKAQFEGQSSALQTSQFYELYLRMKENPSNISENFLRDFIRREQNMGDSRLFDVVALTGYTPALTIWFEVSASMKGAVRGCSGAYTCFNYLVDSGMGGLFPLEDGELPQIGRERNSVWDRYVQLSRGVMMGLLSEKKDTTVPLLGVMKRLLKVAIGMVINFYPDKQFFQTHCSQLQLICSKFSFPELSRCISCLSFYYELLMGKPPEADYQQFCRSCLPDKSNEIYQTLQLIYELRSGRKSLTVPQRAAIVQKQPMAVVLFQSESTDSSLLQLKHNLFMQINQKYEVYFLLLHKYHQEEQLPTQAIETLLDHLGETLRQQDFTLLSPTVCRQAYHLQELLNRTLESHKEVLEARQIFKLSQNLLYLASLHYFPQECRSLSAGLVLNSYSRLLKMLSVVFGKLKLQAERDRGDSIEYFLHLCKTNLCASLELCKVRHNLGEEVCEAGFGVFYQLLFEFVCQHESQSSAILYMKYVNFELGCLTGKVEQTGVALDEDSELLKMFCRSVYIPKSIKNQILRRLLREQGCGVRVGCMELQDLHQLIISTEDKRQKSIYAHQIGRLFGEQGIKYLKIQAKINPKTYEFLADLNQQDL